VTKSEKFLPPIQRLANNIVLIAWPTMTFSPSARTPYAIAPGRSSSSFSYGHNNGSIDSSSTLIATLLPVITQNPDAE